MRKISRKGIVKKLDRIVSQIVILRDKRCVTCGSRNNLGCGHLFSRIAYSTRWDLDNCFCSCWNCNFSHEYDPYPLMTYAEKRYGKRKLENLHIKYKTAKKYRNYELEELFDLLKEKAMADYGNLRTISVL